MHKILTAFLLVLLVLGVTPVSAFDDNDFQTWHIVSLEKKLSDHWKIKFEEELPWADDVSFFSYHHSDFGVVYQNVTPWLDAGLAYRQVNSRSADDWQEEYRPYGELMLKKRFPIVQLKDRHRWEYRHKLAGDHYGVYRNKVYIMSPRTSTKLHIQPYVADEIFVSFDSRELNENWLEPGIWFDLSRALKMNIYYCRRSFNPADEWKDEHVLGTSLKWSF